MLCARYTDALGPFGDAPGHIDTLVLGCTHYVFVQALLQQLVGTKVQILSTGDAVARQTRRLAGNLANGSGHLQLHASAHPERLHAALPRLKLGHLMPRLA